MGLQQNLRGRVFIYALVNAVRLPLVPDLKMFDLLNAKQVGRQFVGIFHGLTVQEHPRHVPVIFLPADSPVLELYNESRVLDNPADNVIGNGQNLTALTLPPVFWQKPSF